MEEQFDRKKIYLLIIASLAILFILLILFNLLQTRSRSHIAPSPTPTFYPTPTSVELVRTSPPPQLIEAPQSIKNAPTYAPEKGQGIDLESEIIQSSTAEVEKLYPYLPYIVDYQLSTGLTVSVVIPDKDLQENPWTLTAQIFGIDYQAPQDSQDYELMKNSFREAAATVLDWIKSKGVDNNKIIIRWGDKALIKERAEEWLRLP